MGAQVIDRRSVLGGGFLGGLLASAFPGFAHADGWPPAPFPRTVRLPVSATRATDMTIWAPTGSTPTRGVALLSTGHGSWPERYGGLAHGLTAHGLVVLAPMHVDSVRYPERVKFSMQASFGERIADMAAASAYAAKTEPGLPVIAVGHSFGTLTALCLAGALAYIGDFRDPSVKAVLGFSSPGRVPGLVRPTAYTTVTAPLMLVTGTADIVPGFVADPADHLLPVETVKGPAYGLVVAKADHDFVGTTRAGLGVGNPDFLSAYLFGDAAARQRLARWKPAAGDRLIVRNAA